MNGCTYEFQDAQYTVSKQRFGLSSDDRRAIRCPELGHVLVFLVPESGISWTEERGRGGTRKGQAKVAGKSFFVTWKDKKPRGVGSQGWGSQDGQGRAKESHERLRVQNRVVLR